MKRIENSPTKIPNITIMRILLAIVIFGATFLVARFFHSCSNVASLEKAIIANNLPVARELLDRQPALVNARSHEFKSTPLHTAAMHGRYEIAELLLELGANPNAVDRYGYTPLHTAANFGKDDLILLLLAHQADPSMVSRKYVNVNFTPLHVAAENGFPSSVKILLENGAKISPHTSPGRNVPPLHIAAGKGNYDVCRVLLEHKADPNELDDNLHPPMYWARETKHNDIADLLFLYGGR